MKIPGHSGTQFKNRKAFKNKLKPIATGKNLDPTRTNAYPEYSYRELLKDRAEHKKVNVKFLLWICIPSAFFLMLYMSYMDLHFLPDKLASRSSVQVETPIVDPKAYDIFVEAGFVALKENRLNDAHLDFMRALKVDVYGKSANLGLTKTLSETCRQRGRFCNEAASYYDFTEKLEDVTEVDLRKLGVGAFF